MSRVTQRMRTGKPDGGLVAQVARFACVLRGGGMDVGLGDEVDAIRALTLVDLLDVAEVRRALRIAFKVRPRHWDQFDQAFHDIWLSPNRGGRRSAAPGRSKLRPSERAPVQAATSASVGPTVFRPVADDATAAGDRPGYSPATLLRKRPFEQCTAEDLDAMTRLLELRLPSLATLRSRRLVAAGRRGIVDLRRSFRRSIGTGGEMLVLARRARPIEKPRLVVLCDTSGSMDRHSRFVLAFVTALRRVVPRIEAFSFNTSLTRLTPWLVAGDVVRTVQRITDGVADWSGGTKIGETLCAFVRDHLETLVNGKTVVAIVSDGLDRGETVLVGEAMEAISSRARRVIWLNPLAGDARYEPTARAMQAAMPFIDRLVPAHNLESLERALFELVASNSGRAGSRGFLP